MASARIWIVIGVLWAADFLLLPLLPFGRMLFDPLFLLLVFRGFHAPSARFLWAEGFLLGLLRDLTTGGVFGGYACSYGLTGWVLAGAQSWVEREDTLVQGIWAVLLGILQSIFYGLLVKQMVHSPGWNRVWWACLPVSSLIHFGFVFWAFPRLRRFLRIRERSRINLYVAQ